MQKLLYITNGINGAGGLERVLSVKASALADMGYDVSILVLNNTHLNPFYTFHPNIRFVSINVKGNPLNYWKSYSGGIKRVVQQIQPEIISVCDDGFKAFFIPKFLKTNAKIIYERHVSKLIESHDADSGLKKFVTHIKWWLMERLASNFTKFVVLTHGNKNEWPTLSNLVVIPNPLSFYPMVSSPLDRKIVISVGRITYQKGQDLLVKVWALVHEKFPDWELHLYGKEDLKVLDTVNLTNNVFHFPPEKNIEEKYLHSSIYVMSSRFEGFGMVLTEAMACGVPCVSFNCDYGPADIIENGIDGYIVEKEDIFALADKLMLLMQDSEMRKKMGKKAKENVKRFNVNEVVQQWDELFKNC